MGWGEDVYYNPEKFDLTPVGEVDISDGCYQFDIFAVWKDEEGTYYWVQDSGCSCPSPFERYTKLEDLESGTGHDAVRALKQLRDNLWDDSEQERVEREIVELITKILF